MSETNPEEAERGRFELRRQSEELVYKFVRMRRADGTLGYPSPTLPNLALSVG